MTAVDDARTLLTRMTDAPLTGVWSAPGRANLTGEHTDYNEGFVFPFAIAQRTAAAAAVRSDDVIRVRSTFADDAVEVSLADLDARIAAAFAAPGFRAPNIFTVTPSEGARRDG